MPRRLMRNPRVRPVLPVMLAVRLPEGIMPKPGRLRGRLIRLAARRPVLRVVQRAGRLIRPGARRQGRPVGPPTLEPVARRRAK